MVSCHLSQTSTGTAFHHGFCFIGNECIFMSLLLKMVPFIYYTTLSIYDCQCLLKKLQTLDLQGFEATLNRARDRNRTITESREVAKKGVFLPLPNGLSSRCLQISHYLLNYQKLLLIISAKQKTSSYLR